MPIATKPRARRRRKRAYNTPAAPNPAADWTVAREFKWNGRNITPGTELSIRGERGRFRFYSHTITEKGAEWIDVIGGTGKGRTAVVMWRSFAPSRIRTVHRLKTTLRTSEARELMREKRAAKRSAA